MENATKALLIAGEVLIVILLIGVGMLIFNSSTQPVQTAVTQMAAQDKQIFNAQFENYAGVQNGTSVRTLLANVISSNAVYDAQVSANTKTTADEISTLRTGISLSKKYTVTLGYTDDGLVNAVTYSEVASSST